MKIRYQHYSASTASSTITPNGFSELWTVNVNTAVASSVLKIYDGQTTSGTLIASVDCGTLASKVYGVLCSNGITISITGGAPDVTIGYY